MKKILLIGGTGIVGNAMIEAALEKKFHITVISNNENALLPTGVLHIFADKYSSDYDLKLKALPKSDFVYDIIEYGLDDAKKTHEIFKDKTPHIIVLSTTLIYDRENVFNEAISESNPSIPSKMYGGYVDSKLLVEDFWLNQTDVNVTLLRAYHILGVGSLLGCLPLHNRDPLIVERIESGETLHLFNEGNIPLNFIHPKDLASAVLGVANNHLCFNKAYNAVNPQVYFIKDYYHQLAALLCKKVNIKGLDYEEVYGRGWEMTLLPHCYDISALQRDSGFNPTIGLDIGLRDALTGYPFSVTATDLIPVFKAMNKGDDPKKISWLSTMPDLFHEQAL
ncbi:NAD-dependent epimerase/dehydratase family protein [Pseudoalteromonas denitrificans]|uniref:Nucleoside-diphosphate-sugar epimerase n=1 Tax=Pseudoalteromonas denitrificans DSM 6059 TaxID=1123010 RepID=A0A1I1G9E2_9GAMM|nr:NAD-dependent epimerase/dehydratase family protein [Pseudoalteromonas denitrificans]SFC05770.1 Nucleoside-diphosphate-sugar epimerase [Pseudoalteromonas denitrificans DSM 6059]